MHALPFFLILFVGIPLIEIYVLIEVGRVIGALPTIGLCVLTAIIGGLLLRQQGLSTLRQAQVAMARGQVPALQVFEGVALGIGGALLMTPGFVTDIIGFLCLLPWSRRALVRFILRRVQVVHPRGPGGPRQGRGGDTIEGEFKRHDQDH